MEEIALSFLLSLSTLFGVDSHPDPGNTWEIQENWSKQGELLVFSVQTASITQECQNSPKGFIEFPTIIHASHRMSANNGYFQEFGDPTISTASPFYSAPVVPCSKLAGATQLSWTVLSYSKYFSRFNSWPTFVKEKSFRHFFNVTANVMAVGGLFLLAIFSLVVFRKKVRNRVTFSVALGCIFLSFYFLASTSTYFNIQWSMLFAHKFADFGLWMGALFLIIGLWSEQAVSKMGLIFFGISILVALPLILFGTTGDVIQFGTSLPFPIVSLVIISGLIRSIVKSFKYGLSQSNSFKIISIAFFVICAHNDIFVVTGLMDGHLMLSIGAVGAFFSLSLAVNDEIRKTYNERDLLLNDLEQKVDEKTQHLVTVIEEREQALQEKQSAQAELIQSAKLASLGTLSAGIAHEINNSINYVNSAVKPLRRLMDQEEIKNRDKIERLLNSIKEGANLTVEIVKSFRNFTGLNQSKFKDVNISEIVKNVATILRNKIKDGHEIINNVPEDLEIYGSTVGLNQVFMNLFSNSIDAMPDGGKITISGSQTPQSTKIIVEDSGGGIPQELLERIFDPFFTTKDVGQGTGLGLYIVNKEIERHHGRIQVEAKNGVGTKFIIELPSEGKSRSSDERSVA